MAATLVRDNATALYRQIAARLRQEIAAGRYEPSGRLASEAEIGARFTVSRVTVRLALQLLEEEGLIERRKGKGTFTLGKQVRYQLGTLRSFHESLSLLGLNTEMRLLSAAITPSLPGLKSVLGADCLCLRRLHLVDGEPVALGCSYLAAGLADFDWAGAAHRPIYSILAEIAGQPVARADIELRAQQADPDLAALLAVKEEAALLVMVRTSFFADDSQADHTVFFIRPERYSFVLSHRFGGDYST